MKKSWAQEKANLRFYHIWTKLGEKLGKVMVKKFSSEKH